MLQLCWFCFKFSKTCSTGSAADDSAILNTKALWKTVSSSLMMDLLIVIYFHILWYRKQLSYRNQIISTALTNISVGSFLSWERRDSLSYVVDYLMFFPFKELHVTQFMGKIFSETQWLLQQKQHPCMQKDVWVIIHSYHRLKTLKLMYQRRKKAVLLATRHNKL